jgi:hypothetical protein
MGGTLERLVGTISLSQAVARSIVVSQCRVEVLTEIIVLNGAFRHMPLISNVIEVELSQY